MMSTLKEVMVVPIEMALEIRDIVWNVPTLDNALLLCIFMTGGILGDRLRRLLF
jgi:hypothetical protein